MKRSKIIETFQFLLKGYPGMDPVELARIEQEFKELVGVSGVKPVRRRMLLEVVHSCRALESTMGAFITSMGIATPEKEKSLGKYLNVLASSKAITHGLAAKIDPHSQLRYQELVTKVRNNMMHRADAYPINEDHLDGFLSVVDAWMNHVILLK